MSTYPPGSAASPALINPDGTPITPLNNPAQVINQLNSGTASSVFTNAAGDAQIQQALNQSGIQIINASPSTSTAGAPAQSQGFWGSLLDAMSSPYSAPGAGFATGPAQVAAGAGGTTQAAAAASGTANTSPKNLGPTATSTPWGNYGMVVFGALLALGALLISQKKNIIELGKTVGAAAL
jgi:hypothetical protein